MEINNYPRLLTIDEAREILRVGRNSMFLLCKEPGFPSLRIRKQLRVPMDKLLLWIDDHSS